MRQLSGRSAGRPLPVLLAAAALHASVNAAAPAPRPWPQCADLSVLAGVANTNEIQKLIAGEAGGLRAFPAGSFGCASSCRQPYRSLLRLAQCS